MVYHLPISPIISISVCSLPFKATFLSEQKLFTTVDPYTCYSIRFYCYVFSFPFILKPFKFILFHSFIQKNIVQQNF